MTFQIKQLIGDLEAKLYGENARGAGAVGILYLQDGGGYIMDIGGDIMTLDLEKNLGIFQTETELIALLEGLSQ